MRISASVIVILICLIIGSSGCQQAANENPEAATASTKTGDDKETNHSGRPGISENAAPQGWTLYTPPEKGFSVMAPGSAEVNSSDTNVGKFRTYVFKKGETPHFELKIHKERKGALAGNSVEELKSDTSDYLPGSLRDISIGDMPGIEFRMKGAIGESVFQEFCSPDNSHSISISVAKDIGAGLTEEEVRLFLDSFKLLP